ncbi:MAG: carboxypeptidase-like regulatory domain-containing protein [Acidobacteriota bacterium]
MSEIPLTQSVPIGESAVSVPLTLAQLPADVVPIAKGCWSPTVHVPVDSVAPIVVEMWPAATVLGGIAFEGKAEKPRTIAGSLVDPSIDRAPESVACELESNVWRCFVPAGRPLHLQVMIDDFAPLFVWDVDIKPGGVEDTGIHMLVRGAAIAGRAVLDRGRPAVNANVQILPLTAGEQKATDRRAKSRQTRTNATGHFQLAGLEAGIYRVVSTMAERGDAVIESIELRAGEHLLLREPLFHAELAEIALLLSPPVSPSQTPWTVELLRRGEREAELVSVANGPASEGGAWNKAGLPPTSYVLRILGPGGSRIVARDIVLRGGREQVVIDVATIGATGKVLAGDKGIAADLTFEHEGRNVTATSNEDGEFIADFPVAGSWKASVTVDAAKVQLEPVEVTAPQEKDLILRIPGGGVKGTVVDQNGRSTAGSLVLLRRGIRQVSRTYSDERGDFHLIGVEAGDYTISAEADDSFGGPLSLTLAKDEIAHVELRLESWKEVSGTVTTPSGAAASGAVVRHFDPLTGMVEDTIADAGGEFSFKVKARSRTIDLVVLAPPHPIAMRQLHLGDRPSLSANVQLAPAGTRLRVYILRSPPWPMLTAPDGVQRSLGLLLMPLFGRGVWREFVDGGFNFFVEPGPYVICGDGRAQCQQLQLAPHAEAVVNFLPAAATGTN